MTSKYIIDPWSKHCSICNWIHQGGWELDEDIELAASRETLEEAGVVGLLGVSYWLISLMIRPIFVFTPLDSSSKALLFSNYCRKNWVNGFSRAKAKRSIMRDPCFPCMSPRNWKYGQRKAFAIAFGYALEPLHSLLGVEPSTEKCKLLWTWCFMVLVLMWDHIIFLQMTVNEAREACAAVWMKEALDEFVCQFTCQSSKVEVDEVPLTSCLLTLCGGEDLSFTIGAKTADNEVDCYLISWETKLLEFFSPKRSCLKMRV